MAHKKGTGSTRNGRDSNSKRLGVKAYGAKGLLQDQLLFAKEVHRFYQGLTLVKARMTHFLH